MHTKELRPIVAGLFAGGRNRTTRVAVEQEFLVSDDTTDTSGATVPIERVRRAARSTAAAPYVGFEPGGSSS